MTSSTARIEIDWRRFGLCNYAYNNTATTVEWEQSVVADSEWNTTKITV